MSSLKDLASLIMVPSLVKDGRLDTVKPLGNSIIHPDATGNNDGTDGSTPAEGNFTFSRGSNLAATRVDVNGLIEKGRENVLLQSQSFDNASWDKTRNVVTANTTTAPDGTNTADKIAVNATFSTNTSRVKQDISVSGLNTISLYAKADEITEMLLFELGNNNGIYFNLTSGSFVSYLNGTTNIIDYNIEDAGNDWYRYSITYSSSITRYAVYLSKSGSYVTDFTIGEGFYVWGGQIESGLVATDYIETGASTAQAGILEDLPRLDYSGGASCPSLKLEPQRTNLLNHGEYFGAWTLNAGGTGSAPVLEANTTDTLSPEGKYNAYKVTFDSGAGTTTSDESIMYRSKSGLTAGSNHTASVYLKGESGGEEVIVRDTEGSYKKWTLTTEWARYDYTQVAAASSYATSFGIRQGVVGIINSDAVVYMYGFQSELGSYPTSYIPTMGSAVTRSQDIATQLNFSNFFDGYDFTMFLELADNYSLVRADSSNNFRISDIGGNNFGSIRIYRASSSATRHRVVFQDNNQNFNPSSVSIDGDNPKIVIRRIYNTGEFKVFVDGVLKLTATNTDYDMFRFIDFAGGGSSMNIKQTLLFPTALTDSECIALTTL